MKGLTTLSRVNWWVALAAGCIALAGLVFIRSATLGDEDFAGLPTKQLLVLVVAAASGLGLVLWPYGRIQRRAWLLYAAALIALLLLPYFGVVVNGARRWYRLPGFFVQPSELAKLATIVALAAYLRFRGGTGAMQGLLMPMLIAGAPAFLVLSQPDLGSSLVFAPILLAMCFAAGVRGRALLAWCAAGAVMAALLGVFGLRGYQRQRVDTWLEHFTWTEAELNGGDAAEALRNEAFQPWQALIGMGSGGWTGHGLQQGPQNRYGFLPYRFDDYIFAVVVEEAGLLGAIGMIGLVLLVVAGLLAIALRTRERFGRLLVVGVAAYFGAQSLMHIAVCSWMVPATGLPMPLVSYGGSSTLVSVWAIALGLSVSAHREPVLASDGFT